MERSLHATNCEVADAPEYLALQGTERCFRGIAAGCPTVLHVANQSGRIRRRVPSCEALRSGPYFGINTIVAAVITMQSATAAPATAIRCCQGTSRSSAFAFAPILSRKPMPSVESGRRDT